MTRPIARQTLILHDERGAALFLVVGLLAVLTMMSTTFFAAVNQRQRASHDEEVMTAAFTIAEGGVHKALAVLQSGDRAYTGERATPLGRGQFSVRVERLERPNEYRIVSLGQPSALPTDNRIVRIESIVRMIDGDATILTWRRLRRSQGPSASSLLNNANLPSEKAINDAS